MEKQLEEIKVISELVYHAVRFTNENCPLEYSSTLILTKNVAILILLLNE